MTQEVVKTVGVSFPPSLLDRLDIIRQDVPRSKYIQRLVEERIKFEGIRK